MNDQPEEDPRDLRRSGRSASLSPQGRFEVQWPTSVDGSEGFTIIRRSDNKPVQRFARSESPRNFNPDDHWFVSVSSGTSDGESSGPRKVRLFDLEREQFAAEFALDEELDDVTSVNFEGGARLLKLGFGFRGRDEMLVPLDPKLTEQFVKWLAGRELTPDERCKYLLDSGDCRDKPVAAPGAGKPEPDPPK